jgi:hypothetical protein
VSATLLLMATQDSNQNFRESVALSRLVDPRPTLENLARNTGVAYDDVVHHALVRYASSGAEALLAWEPYALREVIAARKVEDWAKKSGRSSTGSRQASSHRSGTEPRTRVKRLR